MNFFLFWVYTYCQDRSHVITQSFNHHKDASLALWALFLSPSLLVLLVLLQLLSLLLPLSFPTFATSLSLSPLLSFLSILPLLSLLPRPVFLSFVRFALPFE